MKNTLIIALCCVGILVAGCSTPHNANSLGAQKPDLALLQGTWSGQEVGSDTPGSPSLTISGNNIEFHGANPQEWYKAKFTLLEDTTPKRLDAVLSECPFPQYVGKTGHAIYKVEGGKLTLTGNEPGNPAVPASFDAPGARQFVFTREP